MDVDEERYKAAKKRVEDLQGFYIHLTMFVIFNLGLFALNYFTRGDDGGWWFYWALIPWGIGLIAHALAVFIIEGPLGTRWEQRKIEEYLHKH